MMRTEIYRGIARSSLR